MARNGDDLLRKSSPFFKEIIAVTLHYMKIKRVETKNMVVVFTYRATNIRYLINLYVNDHKERNGDNGKNNGYSNV